MPRSEVTVNLAPADLPKAGSAFDLPISLGVLIADGKVSMQDTRGGGGGRVGFGWAGAGLPGSIGGGFGGCPTGVSLPGSRCGPVSGGTTIRGDGRIGGPQRTCTSLRGEGSLHSDP